MAELNELLGLDSSGGFNDKYGVDKGGVSSIDAMTRNRQPNKIRLGVDVGASM